ncbi:MAG: hypothetical protein MHMPM18_000576 [Marteilia pararefringens]
MLDCKLLCFIDQRLRLAKQNESDFGGVKIILVGDPCQLPPVKARGSWTMNEELGQSCSSTSNSTTKSSKNTNKTPTSNDLSGIRLYSSFLSAAYLTQSQQHQGDDRFSSLVNRIVKARMTKEDVKLLQDNNRNNEMNNSICLTSTNRACTQMNKASISRLVNNRKFIFTATKAGKNGGANIENIQGLQKIQVN